MRDMSVIGTVILTIVVTVVVIATAKAVNYPKTDSGEEFWAMLQGVGAILVIPAALAAFSAAHGSKQLQLETTRADTWHGVHRTVVDLYCHGVSSPEIAALLASPRCLEQPAVLNGETAAMTRQWVSTFLFALEASIPVLALMDSANKESWTAFIKQQLMKPVFRAEFLEDYRAYTLTNGAYGVPWSVDFEVLALESMKELIADEHVTLGRLGDRDEKLRKSFAEYLRTRQRPARSEILRQAVQRFGYSAAAPSAA